MRLILLTDSLSCDIFNAVDVGSGLLVTAAAGSGSGLAGDWAATEMRTEEEEEVWTLHYRNPGRHYPHVL